MYLAYYISRTKKGVSYGDMGVCEARMSMEDEVLSCIENCEREDKKCVKGRSEYCGSGCGITLYVTCLDKGGGRWLILTAAARE